MKGILFMLFWNCCERMNEYWSATAMKCYQTYSTRIVRIWANFSVKNAYFDYKHSLFISCVYWKPYFLLLIKAYLWIRGFPAFMNWKCPFTFITALWISAGLKQIYSNMSNFFVQSSNMRINFFKVRISIVINHFAKGMHSKFAQCGYSNM